MKETGLRGEEGGGVAEVGEVKVTVEEGFCMGGKLNREVSTGGRGAEDDVEGVEGSGGREAEEVEGLEEGAGDGDDVG